jgi:ATP-dependent DNA helicase RecG
MPEAHEDLTKAREGLAYIELMVYQIAMRTAAMKANKAGAPSIPVNQDAAKRFAASLPFPLTGDQKKAVWGLLQEMEKPEPVRALLQGDVGSGKTAVAAFLAAMVHRKGQSAAILAPTELTRSTTLRIVSTFLRWYYHLSDFVYAYGEETFLSR